jgi:hypothetical protein
MQNNPQHKKRLQKIAGIKSFGPMVSLCHVDPFAPHMLRRQHRLCDSKRPGIHDRGAMSAVFGRSAENLYPTKRHDDHGL